MNSLCKRVNSVFLAGLLAVTPLVSSCGRRTLVHGTTNCDTSGNYGFDTNYRVSREGKDRLVIEYSLDKDLYSQKESKERASFSGQTEMIFLFLPTGTSVSEARTTNTILEENTLTQVPSEERMFVGSHRFGFNDYFRESEEMLRKDGADPTEYRCYLTKPDDEEGVVGRRIEITFDTEKDAMCYVSTIVSIQGTQYKLRDLHTAPFSTRFKVSPK